ncbi:hypothetical protein [Microbulbifer sp. GL-2]|uniref:hypothetical protein n=1 Tax=Microbulbifer sp. GL-2 TaxID=2591606 RepID=UPI001162A2F7|nr:hypothetical protein [Microbulbifer sp. GL-2]BBM01350.1 hypothetical protein GL2_14240 [Microbulbifer sp. GL-2]
MRILIFIYSALSLISGCTSSTQYHIATIDIGQIDKLGNINVQIDSLENGLLTVDIYPEPWRYISISSNIAAAQYSTPPPPSGTSPGQAAAVGVAGSLIGSLIASEMAKSQAQKEAQAPAQPLIDALSTLEIEPDIQKKISEIIQVSDFAINRELTSGEELESDSAHLNLSPSIKLSNTLSVLKFNINAELRDKSNKLVYQNSVEYWSEESTNTVKSENLSYWKSEDMEAFLNELNLAIAYTASYLAQSLSNTLPEEEKQQKTLKVASDNSWVMLRGNLLSDNDSGCVVIRDLRGNIKIIRGKLL